MTGDAKPDGRSGKKEQDHNRSNPVGFAIHVRTCTSAFTPAFLQIEAFK